MRRGAWNSSGDNIYFLKKIMIFRSRDGYIMMNRSIYSYINLNDFNI